MKKMSTRDRQYKLYCSVKFAMERKEFLEAANSYGSSESKMIERSYNEALLDIKELLNIADTLEILELTWSSVSIPKKYWKQSVELFPHNMIHGFFDRDTKVTILIK